MKTTSGSHSRRKEQQEDADHGGAILQEVIHPTNENAVVGRRNGSFNSMD
jgi:hypothetical protein